MNLIEQENPNDDIHLMQELLECLENSIVRVSFDRLQFNELETRLNVFDFDKDHINAFATNRKIPLIFLSDKTKSLVNYFVKDEN